MVQCLIAALLVTGHLVSFWDRARLSSVGTNASGNVKDMLYTTATQIALDNNVDLFNFP